MEQGGEWELQRDRIRSLFVLHDFKDTITEQAYGIQYFVKRRF